MRTLPDYKRNRKDIYSQDNSLGALAKTIGVHRTTLEKTVAAYNSNPRAGTPGLLQPPFIALGPVRVGLDRTGTRVSTAMEVLSKVEKREAK